MSKTWKPFELSDTRYFELSSSACAIDATKLVENGLKIYPYITRTEKNNGIARFVSKQADPINEGNAITIGLDTQTVFYQDHNFYTGQNIQVLRVKGLTKNIGLFLIPLIKNSLFYLNWGGNGATLGRLLNKKIILPINEIGEPDFDWMETFMKNKYDEIKASSNIFQKHQVSNSPNPMWKPFKIEHLLNLRKGRCSSAKILEAGGPVPFIGAKYNHNGVMGFYKEDSKYLFDGNAICFICNGEGSIGLSIYKQEKFIPTTDVTVGYSKHLNKYVGNFMVTVANTIRSKYDFGYKRTLPRLKNEILMLPATSSGEPDYEYMENYMKDLENKLIDKLNVVK